jgi:hypothetical protein
MTTLTKIKTVTGYNAQARFINSLALSAEPTGEVSEGRIPCDYKSRYAWTLKHNTFYSSTLNAEVLWTEVRHGKFVFLKVN